MALVLALLTPISGAEGLDPVTVGGPALAFTLPAINVAQAETLVRQPEISLGELVGVLPAHPARGVVLYFFDRADGGEGLRPLNTIARRYEDEQVRILAISVDPDPHADDWVRTLRLDYPVLRDHHRVVADRYGVRSLPLVVVVDAQGMVHSAGAPAMMELEATLESQIQGLLAQPR